MKPRALATSADRALVAALISIVAACGKEALPDAPPSIPAQPASIDVVVSEPIAAAATTAPLSAPTPSPRQESAPAPPEPVADPLPATWSGPSIPKLAFADAMARARAARDDFTRLGPAPRAAAADASVDDPQKAWFAKAYPAVDRASRMYAAAFHAGDAAREGRIDAIAEAAELVLTLSQRLDELGLAAMPVAWRTDPALASTFEDVAVGPTRRWRDEARALAKQCVETARATGVVTPAAKTCASLPTGARAKVAKRASDAGASCACDPGDPLCSASLGGWCGP
ncbi:MAG: hypothetical protein JST00_26645 [Deltaproteobacteria bacterium]|nr:hypothetical protein [Deltaproteobacteria bacterium]